MIVIKIVYESNRGQDSFCLKFEEFKKLTLTDIQKLCEEDYYKKYPNESATWVRPLYTVDLLV